MRPVLIRGGRVIDPSRNTDEVADLYLEHGKIGAVGRDIGSPDEALVLEAAGKVVTPGLIDLHVHLREVARGTVIRSPMMLVLCMATEILLVVAA